MNRAELEALLARVEKATGPDRELDREVAVAAGVALRKSGDKGIEFAPGGTFNYPDAYTASIDAALALVERVLPGRHIHIDTHAERYEIKTGPHVFTARAEIYRLPLSQHPVYVGLAATPPLAILAALLRALIAQSETVEA